METNKQQAADIGRALQHTSNSLFSRGRSASDTLEHTVSWMLWAHRNPEKVENFLQVTKEIGDELGFEQNGFSEIERKVELLDRFLLLCEVITK